MPTTPRPQALAGWVDFLTRQPLPVLPHTFRALQGRLGVPSVGVAELADIVVTDPIMMVHVIREVNRALKGRVQGSLMDIHHCLSLLGLKRCKTLFSAFRSLDQTAARQKADIAYLGSLVISLHAAEQVALWQTVRPQANPDQIRLATLLAGVPYWCLWRFAATEMKVIQTLQYQEMIPRQIAEQAVLGCSVEDIVLAIAQQWDFPELVVNALDTHRMPAKRLFVESAWQGMRSRDPQLPLKDHRGQLVSTAALPVMLANWLAQSVPLDWYAKRTRQVIAIVGCYLGVDYDRARNLVQQGALRVSVKVSDWAPCTPAANLLWPLQPQRRRRIRYSQLPVIISQLQEGKKLSQIVAYPVERDTTFLNRDVQVSALSLTESERNAVAPSPVPVRSALSKAFESADKQRQFAQYQRRLSSQPDYYSSEFEALRDLVTVLADTTRLGRVWVAKLDAPLKVLRTYYGRGLEQYPEWQRLELALQPVNLFTRLLKKPQGIWLQGDLSLTALGAVPGEFRHRMHNEQGFVHSVFHARGPFAVLYADRPDAESLSETEYQVFRMAAMGCTRHLIARGKLPGTR